VSPNAWRSVAIIYGLALTLMALLLL